MRFAAHGAIAAAPERTGDANVLAGAFLGDSLGCGASIQADSLLDFHLSWSST
jgi:hypothetical protein